MKPEWIILLHLYARIAHESARRTIGVLGSCDFACESDHCFRKMPRMQWGSVLLCCALGLGLGCASHDEVDRAKCERFRDHMIDLRLEQNSGAKDSLGQPIDLAPHRAALKQALGDGFLASCEKTLTPKQLECALAAKDSAAASSCTSSH